MTPLFSSLRAAAVLFAFAIVGTALLALTYAGTKDRIADNETKAKRALIDGVLPREAYDNDLMQSRRTLPPTAALGTLEATDAYVARRGGGTVGAVFEAVAEGYAGPIRLLIAVLDSPQGATVAGVRVIAHRETPGLGDYIDPAKDRREPKWNAQFAGRGNDARWRVEKDGGDFTAYAGATITPRAVVGRVGAVLAYYNANRALFAGPADPAR